MSFLLFVSFPLSDSAARKHVYVQRCQKGWWRVYVCATSTEARTVSRVVFLCSVTDSAFSAAVRRNNRELHNTGKYITQCLLPNLLSQQP